ncbi:hypothetical protein [Pendulispora albinea]|uniref:Calcineurin-like phosphoesterase domain-containing protein n=1 Tax=Pendulispora albinea TaxID=2741071 RepID=A0ABZ2LMK0_9BACT
MPPQPGIGAAPALEPELPARSTPIRLSPAPPDVPRSTYTRGRRRPRAIAWFGFTAFWGHLRHLVASAIATENIDSRQWMVPDAPPRLIERAADVLSERGAKKAPTLVEAMGRDLWIDFVADTGDDVSVSEAVARLVFGTYELEDGTRLPRGDVLILGGDLAYPVATVREVSRRLVKPWNRVLEELGDEVPRVLLAIPGNHDWYDGLDGFARLCQAPCAFEQTESPLSQRALHPVTNEFPVLAWADAFRRGVAVDKPDTMALYGYTSIQRASYFRLPLAPSLELFAVDRQLKRIDPRQQAYFRVPSSGARIVMMPDPARAYGEVRPNGALMLNAIGIDAAQVPTLFIAGDVHHYERSSEGASLHVVAGGGGAFLHGARVSPRGAAYRIDAEFPGPRASRQMLGRLPWHVASGGSGWLITAVFAAGHALALLAYVNASPRAALGVSFAMSVSVAVGTALLIGWRRHRAWRSIPFAMAFGLLTGMLPVDVALIIDRLGVFLTGAGALPRTFWMVIAWLVATWGSGLAFGAMLAMIHRLGLNHSQPFAALGSPAYRHFLRLRVDHEGRVEVFAVGLVDPLAKDEKPLLIDRFTWSAHSPLRHDGGAEDDLTSARGDRIEEHGDRPSG